jgi:hypothetical protein
MGIGSFEVDKTLDWVRWLLVLSLPLTSCVWS